MSLQTRLTALVSAIGADIKSLDTKYNSLQSKVVLDGGATPTEPYDDPPPSDGVYAAPNHSHPYSPITHGHDYADPAHTHNYLPLSGKAADSELLDGYNTDQSYGGNTIAVRDANGRLVVVSPTSGDHAATKAYVDTNFHRFGLVGTASQPSNATNISGGSLNRHHATGVYNGDGLSNTPAPLGAAWCYLEVMAHVGGSHWQHQKITGMTAHNGRSWERWCSGGDPNVAGSWTPWYEVGGYTGWIEMSSIIGNGASPYTTGLGNSWTPRYRKHNGVVYLAGLVNVPNTVGVNIATLPMGYRPSLTEMFGPMTSSNYPRRMDINSAGQIFFDQGASVPHMGWHSLNCSFVAEN